MGSCTGSHILLGFLIWAKDGVKRWGRIVTAFLLPSFLLLMVFQGRHEQGVILPPPCMAAAGAWLSHAVAVYPSLGVGPQGTPSDGVSRLCSWCTEPELQKLKNKPLLNPGMWLCCIMFIMPKVGSHSLCILPIIDLNPQ